ncbi:MAG TPA: hypothetical protein VJI46_05845 [Candidatus Nanoarchaeia archaeon]|nr:hypothetical protein [Candidatus Nanoarchaeia archaeon]
MVSLDAMGVEAGKKIEELRAYFHSKITAEHADVFFSSFLREISPALQTKGEFMDVGKHYADAVSKVYGNGSFQFGDAVHALVDSRLAKTSSAIDQGIDILVEAINPMGHGEHRYFEVAEMMRKGRFRSLEDIGGYAPLSKLNSQVQ